MHGIIYARMVGEQLSIYLGIFDDDGTRLSTQTLACEMRNKLCSISSNFVFEQKGYQWDGPIKEYRGKFIGKHKLVTINYFKINEKGDFEHIQEYCGTDRT